MYRDIIKTIELLFFRFFDDDVVFRRVLKIVKK